MSALRSLLETVEIASGRTTRVWQSERLFEAPNWSRDARSLLFNQEGRLYTIPVDGTEEPRLLDTGFAITCNNDHGLSPDGTLLALSDDTASGRSQIYVLPSSGGTPRLVTPNLPSYWHGWSPDGATLAYCAERDGTFGIFTVPVAGGPERRLTRTDGLDDGPDYSPDGRWIYFNSDRTGRMQIWRMHPDGGAAEQVTDDGFNNWFAHPSPDGRWLVLLSYLPDVKGHPPDRDVTLRLAPIEDGRVAREKLSVLVSLFGGQGTINVPSWSPDSASVAYVRYRPPA
jgi:Tol biopolymer transport system component